MSASSTSNARGEPERAAADRRGLYVSVGGGNHAVRKLCAARK